MKITTVILILMLVPIISRAEDFIVSKKIVSKTDGVISMGGPFEKPGVVNAGEVMFCFHQADGKFPQLKWGDVYRFVGRTGENTFEVKYSHYNRTGSKFMQDTEDEKILKLYFEKNLEANLNIIPLDSSCIANPVYAKLKMLELKGNQLKFQIILPDCLIK